MGVLTYPDLPQRLTPYESSVRSTALAYRFMLRRRLAQFRGQARTEDRRGAGFLELRGSAATSLAMNLRGSAGDTPARPAKI